MNRGERQLTSSKELREVSMYVYTNPAGLFGRMVGRSLRLRVHSFTYFVNRRDNALRRVEVEADSLVAECEVLGQNYLERVALTFPEAQKVSRRARGEVLNVARYPIITYEVEHETPEDVTGTLHLRGESHPVKCTKKVDGNQLVVRCPVSLRMFHVPAYKHWLGLFSEADIVEVVTQVPANVLKL